jgi:hypothetical protein
MESKIIRGCAPPSCSCFELEVYTDIDGKEMVAISDDLGGVAIDTRDSFQRLVQQYIRQYGIEEYNRY